VTRIGYGRVSTRDQNPDSQHDALTAAGCEKIFIDKASGKLPRRPEWDRCLAYLRAGDELVITKLDRAGRSVRHLLDIAAELQRREIDFVILQQGIDTTTPAGGSSSTSLPRWPSSSATSSPKAPTRASPLPGPEAGSADAPPSSPPASSPRPARCSTTANSR
jgi:hypothetical protein